jgi:hypothetical protein
MEICLVHANFRAVSKEAGCMNRNPDRRRNRWCYEMSVNHAEYDVCADEFRVIDYERFAMRELGMGRNRIKMESNELERWRWLYGGVN